MAMENMWSHFVYLIWTQKKVTNCEWKLLYLLIENEYTQLENRSGVL